MAMQPKNASDIITFTRSTAAWEWDWQGNYSEVAAGVMRIAHDPLTKSGSVTPQTLGTGSYTFATTYQYPIGKAVRVSADANNWMVGRVTASTPDSVTIWVSTPPVGAGTYSAWTLIVRRGIRVEEQRTNLLLHSADPTNAAWTKANATVGTSGTGPGGLAAKKLVESVGASVTPSISQFTTVAAGATVTGIRIVKAGERSFVRMQIASSGGTAYAASRFNLVDGAKVAGDSDVALNSATNVRSGSVNCGGGWWLLWLSCTLPAGAGNASFATRIVPDAVAFAYTGDGTSGIYIGPAQLEVGATPSSLIPTAASQVIRAADVPNVNTLAPWFNPLEGLLVARVIRESISPSQTLVALSGTSISTISLESGAGNPAQLRMRVSVDGVQVAIPVAANSSAAYTPIKMAAAYKKDFFSVSANGAPPAEDTSGTVPVVTRLEIGSVNNAARLNGIIEDITYHPRVQDTQQASA